MDEQRAPKPFTAGIISYEDAGKADAEVRDITGDVYRLSVPWSYPPLRLDLEAGICQNNQQLHELMHGLLRVEIGGLSRDFVVMSSVQDDRGFYSVQDERGFYRIRATEMLNESRRLGASIGTESLA